VRNLWFNLNVSAVGRNDSGLHVLPDLPVRTTALGLLQGRSPFSSLYLPGVPLHHGLDEGHCFVCILVMLTIAVGYSYSDMFYVKTFKNM